MEFIDVFRKRFIMWRRSVKKCTDSYFPLAPLIMKSVTFIEEFPEIIQLILLLWDLLSSHLTNVILIIFLTIQEKYL